MKGMIFDIKELALHDGPGIRTTVFLKGCPLRCKWCHNPDGFSPLRELSFNSSLCTDCGSCRRECEHEECKPFSRCIRACPRGLLRAVGREVGVSELADELISGASVLGDAFGGFTFSGGEPLMQWEFLCRMLDILSPYHRAIETSGYAEESVFRSVIDRCDLVIMDIKIADSDAHKFYTGRDNRPILNNLRGLMNSGRQFLIRTPLIPGITDTADNLRAIRELIGGAEWEQLPYNTMAGAKYSMLGLKYEL